MYGDIPAAGVTIRVPNPPKRRNCGCPPARSPMTNSRSLTSLALRPSKRAQENSAAIQLREEPGVHGVFGEFALREDPDRLDILVVDHVQHGQFEHFQGCL